MKNLYVGWQDQATREWIPVAKLERSDAGYKLTYTAGAHRCQGFSGLGRMTKLDASYFSPDLFPFFENRIIKKSRPEYKKYLEWIGIENLDPDPLKILQVTGGIRSTDNFELFSTPSYNGKNLCLEFFPRGLRYTHTKAIDDINNLSNNTPLFVMHDLQNDFDKAALLLRTNEPSINIGYIPKYYNKGLKKLLDSGIDARVLILQVNKDAPIDMRILCRLEINASPDIVDLLTINEDFSDRYSDAISATNDPHLNDIATTLNFGDSSN
jgi:hypothetical protein